MTRTQLILCATAFSAVVYLPGVRSRAADDPAANGHTVAQRVQRAPRVSGPVKAMSVASRPGLPRQGDAGSGAR